MKLNLIIQDKTDWIDIKPDIQSHIDFMWKSEQSSKDWFVASSKVWLDNKKDFENFCNSCTEIYAIMNDKPVMAVFMEQDRRTLDIHLGVYQKVRPKYFMRKCDELKKMKFSHGITKIRGWVLKKNFPLLKLITKIGFEKTKVVEVNGEYRNKNLVWKLVEAVK